jgi:hypothetical protein
MKALREIVRTLNYIHLEKLYNPKIYISNNINIGAY